MKNYFHTVTGERFVKKQKDRPSGNYKYWCLASLDREDGQMAAYVDETECDNEIQSALDLGVIRELNYIEDNRDWAFATATLLEGNTYVLHDFTYSEHVMENRNVFITYIEDDLD